MATEYVIYIEIHNEKHSPSYSKEALWILDSSETFLGEAWQSIAYPTHSSATLKFFRDLKHGDAELEDFVTKANEEIYTIYGSYTEVYYRIIDLDSVPYAEYEFDEYHPEQAAA